MVKLENENHKSNLTYIYILTTFIFNVSTPKYLIFGVDDWIECYSFVALFGRP